LVKAKQHTQPKKMKVGDIFAQTKQASGVGLYTNEVPIEKLKTHKSITYSRGSLPPQQ